MKVDSCFTFTIINTKSNFFFMFTKKKFRGCDHYVSDESKVENNQFFYIFF